MRCTFEIHTRKQRAEASSGRMQFSWSFELRFRVDWAGGVRNLHVARVLDILFDCHDALSELTASPIIASSASERRSQLGALRRALCQCPHVQTCKLLTACPYAMCESRHSCPTGREWMPCRAELLDLPDCPRIPDPPRPAGWTDSALVSLPRHAVRTARVH